MNILFVNNIAFNPQFGGIERVTDILTKELKQYGHIVYYLVFSLDKNVEYEYPAQIFLMPSRDNVEINKSFVKKLVEQNQIDIIVNQRGQTSTICDMLLVDDVKIINVLHSPPGAWIRSTHLRILNNRRNTLTAKIRYIIKLILLPIIFLNRVVKVYRAFQQQYRYILSKFDAVVLLSEKYKDDLRYIVKLDLTKYKVVGIPNPNTYKISGMDCSSFKENVILYVGRLDKVEKSPERLIKVWEKLYKKYPDWTLEIVGDGECMEDMKRYVIRKEIQRVSFEGCQADPSKYYQRASFICLTSNYEGWGMSLTEGMQYGCVPFTFNNYGAASDIIEDGISGCLITPFCLNEYSSRLAELMDDSILRERMSTEARIKSSQFEGSVVAGLWDCLFRSLYNESI